MSCQTFLPVSLHQAEAEGLASTPCSVDSAEQCEEHEESLTLFCLDDLEPLCEQCAAVSHAGHRVYLLAEAATDCKEELRTSLNGLKKKMIDFQKVTQTCEHAIRHNQAEAKLTEKLMRKEFDSLHQFFREEKVERMLALREEQQEKKQEAEEQKDRMNQVIKSLEEKIRLVEEELDAEGDGVAFLEHFQDTMNSTWADHRKPQEMCGSLLDVAKHLGNLQYAEWEKMKHIAPYTPVTLDPRTAGPFLRVSPGLNSVHISPGPSPELGQSVDVLVPDNPERFHPYSCILAREGFDSGVHCWDIEVGDTNNWTVGVAAQSVSTRAEFEACPEAGLWCISLQEGEYLALTTPARTLKSHHFSRVSVRLNWDEGTLEFMNADTDMNLFTFQNRFTEKVYPYFESMSSCGGFTVLARRVRVSLGSDDVPVDDNDINKEDQVMKRGSSSEGDINRDKNLICSVREETKTKCTMKDCLIKTKPAGKEETKDDKPAYKKQGSKPRFSVTYHVSLRVHPH